MRRQCLISSSLNDAYGQVREVWQGIDLVTMNLLIYSLFKINLSGIHK